MRDPTNVFKRDNKNVTVKDTLLWKKIINGANFWITNIINIFNQVKDFKIGINHKWNGTEDILSNIIIN